jgi:hypothetical protein
MGDKVSVRSLRTLLSGVLAGLAACDGCTCAPVDYPVSSPPSEATASHRSFAQSETSMVRVDLPPNRPQGQPASRFVVGYNDDTDAVANAGANCWQYPGPASLDGWATSDSFGGPWVRQPQLPVSPALIAAGVNARHGDPWLAAWNSKTAGVQSIVLYVSVAQTGLARYGPPWFLLASRSRDNGQTFEEGRIILGPQPDLPDGPKVAITGDGNLALVAWSPGGPYLYKLIWGLDQPTMQFTPASAFDPRANANPPDPGCTDVRSYLHPHIAAGRSTFYWAGEFTYTCPSGFVTRIEVHRNSSVGLAFGAPWERILSAQSPASIAGAVPGVLNAQDVTTPARFGTRTDRGGILPALAVGEDVDGEFAIVVTEQVQAGTQPDEAHREKLIQFRIPGADSCNAAGHKGDLDSCGLAITGQEIDSIATAGDISTVRSRGGLWASKPALFTGKVPDGKVDTRVGLLWYAQPYKGRLSVDDEHRARTIVEAAISKDAGKTWSGPFTMTVPSDHDGIFDDPDIGAFFYPCTTLCNSYYGEYISGAFQFAEPGLTAMVGAWGDSREGCTNQMIQSIQHQHVWAGALRAKPR